MSIVLEICLAVFTGNISLAVLINEALCLFYLRIGSVKAVKALYVEVKEQYDFGRGGYF